MTRILRVCKSEDLPQIHNRERNYIYFLYDKMVLYLGQNYYSDPFCIVDEVPEAIDAVEELLYITLSGDVKIKYNNEISTIGGIEDPDQLALLRKAGTVYFMRAESRYLDIQKKVLVLPYQNGSFQLSVSLPDNIKIDENTVIRYNPESGKFEVDGNYHEEINDKESILSNYKGEETNTIQVIIKDNSVRANLKISDNPGNILKVQNNGLYANTGNCATREDLNKVAQIYRNYKNEVNSMQEMLNNKLTEGGFDLPENIIESKVHDALVGYSSTIDELIESYNDIEDMITYIANSTQSYAEEQLLGAKNDIVDYLNNMQNAWHEMDDSQVNPTNDDILTEEEAQIMANAIAEARSKIMMLREESDSTNGYEVPLYGYLVGTPESSDFVFMPDDLNVVSERGSKVGYSKIFVYDELLDNTDRYYYKITEELPYNMENVSMNGYIPWDGETEIEVENEASIIIVETNSDKEALKYAKLTALSRLAAPLELPIININSTEGTTVGTTELIFSPALEPGNVYMFDEATTIPEYDSIISENYKLYDGSVDMSLYDGKLLTFVECDSHLHKCKKVGLVRIATANEILKRLNITTTPGATPLSTIVHRDGATSSGNELYYKVAETISLPYLNQYIGDDRSWIPFESNDMEITVPDFGYQICVIETDSKKIKKAGIAYINANNSIEVSATYDTNEFMVNNVTVDAEPGASLYYKLTELSSTIHDLEYNDDIPSGFELLTGNSITIPDASYETINIIESYDGNKVRRFGQCNTDIDYAPKDITFTAVIESINNEDPEDKKGKCVLSDIDLTEFADGKLYLQIVYEDNIEAEFILNETIDTVNYKLTEGEYTYINNIEDNMRSIRLVYTDNEGHIKRFGECYITCEI